MWSINLYAHDFEVGGIYYNILSSTEVEVSCRGDLSYDYFDEYTGSVVIPERVTYNGTTYTITSIGKDAFELCSGLTEITIPNSVTSIGNCAFYNYENWKEIIVYDNTTHIGEYAFANCLSLSNVVLGKNIKEIGNYTFDGSIRIKSVYVYADTPPTIYQETFTVHTTVNATLYTPKGKLNNYAKASYWKYFFDIQEDLSAIETVTIDADNTPTEYYDLSGRRVIEPTHGIYIMKQGSTVTKVVL